MNAAAAALIATRKITIANYLRRLARIVEEVPDLGEWSHAGDLGRIESALGELLETHGPKPVLDPEAMTVWFATREPRDLALAAALDGAEESDIVIESRESDRGYGLRIDGRSDAALDEAVELLSRLAEPA